MGMVSLTTVTTFQDYAVVDYMKQMRQFKQILTQVLEGPASLLAKLT